MKKNVAPKFSIKISILKQANRLKFKNGTLPMYEWYIRNVRMVHPQSTKLTFVSLPAQNACG